MSEDRIAAIRARHTSETGPRRYELKAQIHDDRAFLLAEVDRQRAEIERLRAEVQRQTRHVEQLYDQIRRRADERDKAQIEVGSQRAEIERLREALTDMLSGWRYIRETYGDLAGIGWDRVEQKAQEALEGKP